MPNSRCTTADNVARGILAQGKQFQDAASDRVTQYVERVHQPLAGGSLSPV